jgi:16S rRNA (uracil1498-N3)-methyltransferase
MPRTHRVFNDSDLQTGQCVSLSDDSAHYLSRVLRVTVGHPIILFNGDGSDYFAEVARVTRNTIEMNVIRQVKNNVDSPLKITLVQAVSRGERMDLSMQKATELGVTAIQPVFSKRTEVRLNESKLSRRMLHWRKVIISACEQCGRASLPLLHQPLDLLTWSQTESPGDRIMLLPGAERSLVQIPLNNEVELIIGPEGGLDESEVKSLNSNGVQAASLGPRVLRTETAGPAAIAILQSAAGDMA